MKRWNPINTLLTFGFRALIKKANSYFYNKKSSNKQIYPQQQNYQMYNNKIYSQQQNYQMYNNQIYSQQQNY